MAFPQIVWKRKRTGYQELKYGLYVLNFGKASHPGTLGKAGSRGREIWMGELFPWSHLVEWSKRLPIYDSFTSLATNALQTNRIRLGTTVTPIPRLKPWEAARETVSHDLLSHGQFMLGVGLGTEESYDYERFGERTHTGSEKDSALESRFVFQKRIFRNDALWSSTDHLQ